MHRILNLARIIGLLAIAVALSGCTALKLGYNTLPQLSAWWLDGYVDFSEEQGARVRDDLARLHQWHRQHELPKLVALLQQAELLAAGELTAAEACAMVPAIRQRLTAVAERAEPAAVTLALNLSPAQLAHLERKYQKNNRDYRNDWIELSAGDQKEKRVKQFVERAEMIYGRLDEPQREALRVRMERSVFKAETALQERQRRQQEILQALRKLAGQPVALPDARTDIRRLMEAGLRSTDSRYRVYQESLLQEACQNVAALHLSTTPQQRQNAVRRLGAYQRELQELAPRP